MELRLQKYLSDCGILSRRAAEREIEAGRVTVNGQRARVGQKIDPVRDEVKFGGRVIRNTAGKRYILLYKPRGYVTTMKDERDRKCIPALLEGIDERIYPCGRLDMDSEGLLLLTNDGKVANTVMHPRIRLEKEYHVKVEPEITPEQLERLNGEMILDGYKINPVAVSIISRKQGKTSLRFVLHEGRNRQIRNMCEQVGLEILRLKRVSVGKLSVGMLKPGRWRDLNRNEIEYVKGLK